MLYITVLYIGDQVYSVVSFPAFYLVDPSSNLTSDRTLLAQQFLSQSFTYVNPGSNPTSDRRLACGLGLKSL